MLRRYWVMLSLGFSVIGLWGCATVVDLPKGFAGISTKVLEDRRGEALAKTFHYNYNTGYDKAKKILNKMGCYIYTQNYKKHLIAFYLSESDTTPVGVFFKEVDLENTKVEVSSPSISAKEYIAKRFFAIMAGLPDPEMKKEKASGVAVKP
ncbi:MAG: hypothetical protein NT033_01990 [Candidatus Omnitrophica bacterium]|nr:hypothetical protein [Candidatus Omnitrophota bacterium]